MPVPFSRTLSSLRADGSPRALFSLIAGALILAAWLVWAFVAKVSVYESTPSAHLEVSSAAHPVDAPVSGRVTRVFFSLGQEVARGDALALLDAEPERLQLEETRARILALTAQRAASLEELEAQEARRLDEQRAARSAGQEARARRQQAEQAAKLSEEEAARLRRLLEAGAVSEAESRRADSEARERRAAALASEHEVQRVDWDARARENDRRAQRTRVEREITVLEGQLASDRVLATRLAYEMERRTIRAPIAGRIGEISPVREGSMVQQGDRLASVVPPGALKIVADYAPAALGRIRAGQAARVRLDGFPWPQYGTIPALVTSVADEPRDGRIRVELGMTPDPTSGIPRQHGLTCAVDVEVERASPAALVLRAVGRWIGALDPARHRARQVLLTN